MKQNLLGAPLDHKMYLLGFKTHLTGETANGHGRLAHQEHMGNGAHPTFGDIEMNEPETRACLFAHPAKHSLSPAMHNAALKFLGIAARYEARDVPPESLATQFLALRNSSLWGVNLSIPHKEAALELVDSVSAEARAMGAINTVVNQNGVLHGLNTDAPGFMAALLEAGCHPSKLNVMVLGAGGASRGVCWALQQSGAQVHLWNRSPARAKQLCNEFGLNFVSDSELEQSVRGSSLLVNTTSVGLNTPLESPLPEGVLPNSGWVCDIVYRPLETKLLKDARSRGLTGIDGLGMLVHQGALALNAWTGRDAPVDVMRKAALAQLNT
jgi:shikimate dehydrogenase